MGNSGKPVLMLAGRALWDAVARFDRKNGWMMSSHIAMSMMLALFPFILFSVALAGFLSQDVNVDDLVELVFGAWPDDVAKPIMAEMQAVVISSNRQLITLGGVLAIYFASNGVDAVRAAMTLAYRDEDTRPFWQARLLCLGFVLVGGVLLLVAAMVEVAVPLYLSFVSDSLPQPVEDWLTGDRVRLLLTMVVPITAVTACHLWLPGHRHSLKQIWPGIVLTIVLWAAVAWGFGIYISRFSAYSATYAGLAGAMAALIFLYLMAAILILGAEYNGALIMRRGQHLANRVPDT